MSYTLTGTNDTAAEYAVIVWCQVLDALGLTIEGEANILPLHISRE